MAVHVVGAFPLGGVNLAASAAIGFIGPMLAEVDLMIAALGLVSADVSLQFNASINAQLQFALQLQNPFATIQATIAALVNVEAALQASLGLAIPTPQIAAQLAAAVAASAAAGLRLGSLQLNISGALSVKLPLVDFIAGLAAYLSLGPIVVASWGFASAPTTLAQTGVDIATLFTTGVGGILPFETVYGVLLTTKVPSASVGLSATLLVV